MKNQRKNIAPKILAAFLVLTLFLGTLPFSGISALAAPRVKPEDVGKDGFAVLEIQLDGYREDEIHRSDWRPILYTLQFDGQSFLYQDAQIKGRGNYTWGQPKRPYAIKCAEKTDWFGFGAAKDWVLLANYTDQTHLRNYVAFTLAAQFDFAFTPQCRPAHVFINGKYNGLYLICEKVEIDKERLDVKAGKGDMLFELDNNYGSSEPSKFTSPMGNLFVLKDPDKDSYAEKTKDKENAPTYQRALLDAKSKVKNFENSVTSRASLDEIGKYMDMASLVDWYIFNEIMKNDDTLFNSSIYLYNEYGGILHMGPVWDYDLAMGGIDRFDGKNVDPTGLMFREDYWGRPNWFSYLLDRRDFMQLVEDRWSQLVRKGAFKMILEEIDRMAPYVEPAYELDFSKWSDGGVFVRSDNYQASVTRLRKFVDKRIQWLDGQWNKTGAVPETATPQPTASPEPSPTENGGKPTPAQDPGKDPDGKNPGPILWIWAAVFAVLTGAAVLIGLLIRRKYHIKD